MQPFSPHAKFFSSLKQVEKRLKSEHNSPLPQLPQPSTQASSADHLSEPLYLYTSCDQPTNDTDDSSAPQEFLSHSPDYLPPASPPSNVLGIDQNVDGETEHSKDDIEELLELLGLLEINKADGKNEMKNSRSGCNGTGSFCSKIVGAKGPKNEKEVERLDKWIEYFLSNKDGEEGVNEPLRLVHLLIGKAIVANEEDSNGGFGDMEFPSTVEEFLKHDPPAVLN